MLLINGSDSSGGDVVGPASATDNALPKFDGTTGMLLQNTVVTADDSGTVNIPTGQTYNIAGAPHTHTGDVQVNQIIIIGYTYFPPVDGGITSENCIRRYNDAGELVTEVLVGGVWEEIERKAK